MTVLDGIRSNTDEAHASLDQAKAVATQAMGEAGELEQSAATHGWGGVAEAMRSAQTTLETTLTAIDSALRATMASAAALGEIADTMSSDEVAQRLGTTGDELGSARSAAVDAMETLDDAGSWARQAEAETVYQMVTAAKDLLESGIGVLGTAAGETTAAQSEATSWGN